MRLLSGLLSGERGEVQNPLWTLPATGRQPVFRPLLPSALGMAQIPPRMANLFSMNTSAGRGSRGMRGGGCRAAFPLARPRDGRMHESSKRTDNGDDHCSRDCASGFGGGFTNSSLACEIPLREAAQSVAWESALQPNSPLPDSGGFGVGRAMTINNLKMRTTLWGPPDRITISLNKNNVWDRRLNTRSFQAPTLQEITEGRIFSGQQGLCRKGRR